MSKSHDNPISKRQDQQKILAKYINPTCTFVPFSKQAINQSIPTRFEQQVERRPKAIAVKENSVSVTYTELNCRANYLARVILDMLGPRSEPIALIFHQCHLLITAILGTLKAGKFYTPLNPLDTSSRNANILTETQARLIITNSTYSPLAHQLAGGNQRVLNIETSEAHSHADNPSITLKPDSFAYIYFTSGSTGRPKGVVDNHRNVLHNVMRYTNSLCISSDDRLSLLQAPHFSGTVSSIFGALLNGAVICPYNLIHQGMDRLATWLNEMEISIYHSVPVIFRSFLRHKNHFPSIRIIRLEGDRAVRDDIKLYQQYFGQNCVLVNGLGATETGLCRQYFVNKEMNVTDAIVPIGYPVDDMDILLVDEAGEKVGFNEVGEIVVKSRYLSLGYWQQPKLTRESFVADPDESEARLYCTGDLGQLRPDGCLEYLGRKDFQCKISGQTVVPAEIEEALLGIAFIGEAVVSTFENKAGVVRLIAYIVSIGDTKPSVAEINRLLSKHLPDTLIPTEYIFLSELPMTGDGKIDRLGLPEPTSMNNRFEKNYVAPQGFVERTIAKIWEEVLNIDRVGSSDNFFALGGDSLRGIQLASLLRNVFSVELPLTTLFKMPTVRELSIELLRLIDNNCSTNLGRMLTEIEELSEVEVARILTNGKENKG